ncbi:hypothetical protein ACFP81_07550 [Deinococcus lacus]|uniref:Uncharacterized protein n=1 Tax=Deinococcus lacus TaxID=392561 RepID=A0ABW1YF35_9DEIO
MTRLQDWVRRGVVCAWALCWGSGLSAPELQGRTLTNAEAAWSRTFQPELGRLTGPLQVEDTVYLGVGPSVYAYSDAGALLTRYDLPAAVTALDASGGPCGL